jgi:hypothetical protein
MNLDISQILEQWPFENGQVSARRIVGRDGREKLQLRLDLGILQMETTGRPDGQRPFEYESLLEYHESQLDLFRNQHGADEGFELDSDACEQLRAEGTMYYHRYLAEFVLEDFEAVRRDTGRNLRLFDFCNLYAREEEDRFALEQYRPYVVMMHARARARIAMGKNQPKRALAALRQGLARIRDCYRRVGQEKAYAVSNEGAVLRAMAKEVQSQIPISPAERLRRQLARAVKDERYEEAARLRDELSQLQNQEHEAGHKP